MAKFSRQLTANKVEQMCLAKKAYVETEYEAALARRELDGPTEMTPLPKYDSINMTRCIEEGVE